MYAGSLHIYDLNNAAAHRHNFKSTRPIMAISIGGQDSSDEITRTDWRHFAEDRGINGDIVIWTVRDFASRIFRALPHALARKSPCEAIIRAEQDINERCVRWRIAVGSRLAPVPPHRSPHAR